MGLSSGERLGPYEIVSRIGAGGMGEVWRARDTRLGREVAIKILTRTGSSDADRIRRFEVEMKAVGRLSHPNVLAVHDAGSHDGVPYLVTELLEGETLRDRLDRGPLPLKAAAGIAVEVAQGLAAAHSSGVVHRDLKPENVFLLRDGRVKLLDFGLAKLVEPPSPISFEGLNEAETAARLTVSGIVVGTVRYMSPEQIRGAPLDHRSDIFAFGAVLFEMLTGQVAFRKPSAIESLSATLAEDPISRLDDPTVIPAEIEPVLRRCLEKDPESRFQSAADLAFHLREFAEGFTRTSVSRMRPVFGRRGRLGRLAAAAAALLVLLGAAGLAWRAGRGSGGAGVPAFKKLTFRRGLVLSARFSPDGKTVVYGASWDGEPFRLFSMRTESPESRPLDLPPGDVLSISSAGEMAISIDRKYVYGFSARGTLARVPLVGGAPRKILTDVEDADFSPDGKELAVSRVVEGRHRLEYPIEKVLVQGEGWISNVRVSPDGEHVAFVDHPIPGDDRGVVCVVDRAGKKKVLSDGWASTLGLDWSPKGDEVWFTATEVSPNCALWAVDLEGRKRLLARSAGRLALQDVGPAGDLLVTEGRVRLGMGLRAAGRDADRDLSWFDATVVSDVSRDGKTVLFGEQGAGGGAGTYSVYMRGADGSPAMRLGEGTAGPLSPDGRWAVAIVPSNPPSLTLLPTGPGKTKTLDRGPIAAYHAVAFFPDGERLLIAGNEEGKPVRLWIQSIESGAPRSVTGSGYRITTSTDAVSPDGRVATVLDASDRVLLYPLDGGEPSFVPGVEPGDIPMRWSADGRALFVFRYDEFPARIRRVDLPSGRREVVATVAPNDPAGIESFVAAQVTPDGRSWVYSFFQYRNDLYLVTDVK
ncbi:MAG: WD40 repeat domain-containing serine/threonine protein kinase [Thermoanaerobaculia bacterium]